MGRSMRETVCQACGTYAPTQAVTLRHNVGMLFMRQQFTTQGALCRSCLHRKMGHHTLCNLTLGWWGTISFFATCAFLIANLVEYASALYRLRGARVAAVAAAVTPDASEALARLAPYEHNVRLRLRAGEAAGSIGDDMARLVGVAPADARGFVERVRAAA
jgi:hypothetical protein